MRAKIDSLGVGGRRHVREGHGSFGAAQVVGLILGEDHMFRGDVRSALLAQKFCRHGPQPGEKGSCRILGGQAVQVRARGGRGRGIGDAAGVGGLDADAIQGQAQFLGHDQADLGVHGLPISTPPWDSATEPSRRIQIRPKLGSKMSW